MGRMKTAMRASMKTIRLKCAVRTKDSARPECPRAKMEAWCVSAIEVLAQNVCDELDHDCDGNPRNGFRNFGRDCQVGRGECRRNGRNICNNRGDGVRCNAVAGAPNNEVCDGNDNDCDGQTDEDLGGSPCGSNVGECNAGREVCRNGRIQCQGADGPENELCNGLDDDCDGQRDEDFPQLGDACTVGEGTCQANGVWVCRGNGAGVVCSVEPDDDQEDEVCNGRDDDCDGRLDEGGVAALCDGSRADRCVDGRCLCGAGNACGGDETCINGMCAETE